MARANPKSTTSAQPAPAALLDPRTFPDEYAMIVAGSCMEPEIPDGAHVLADKRRPTACRAA